ncbi:transposase [Pirellulaceae bacterium SH501]
MANGHMGKKICEKTKQDALKLVNKGNTIPQVARRLGLSESVIRNWVRVQQKTLEPQLPRDPS